MSYTELTVWTRGIIMDKEGRDIVNSVAAAGRLEGKFAQAMENYVDNPDRTNAPTRKYCRLSGSEIRRSTWRDMTPSVSLTRPRSSHDSAASRSPAALRGKRPLRSAGPSTTVNRSRKVATHSPTPPARPAASIAVA